MTTVHPLLTKTQASNASLFIESVQALGLQVKTQDGKAIIKYPESLRRSTEEWVLQSRGTIWDLEKMSLICRPIRGACSVEEFREKVPWSRTIVELCVDGTLMNVYWDPTQNSWNVSTKFDRSASGHFRSTRSFRELLDDIIDFDILTSRIDKDYTYSFLLIHHDNRNVTPISDKDSIVYHLESTHNRTGKTVHLDVGIPHIPIVFTPEECILNAYTSKTNRQHSFRSFDDIIKYVHHEQPWYVPGLMCWSIDRTQRCHIVNPRFEYVKSLLGNQADIRYCIVDLLKAPTSRDEVETRWVELTKYYPEYRSVRSMVEQTLTAYIRSLYDTYVAVKIMKQHRELEYPYRGPIMDIHKYYIEQKKTNCYFSIREGDVWDIVWGYSPSYLFSLLFPRKTLSVTHMESTESQE